MPSTPKKQAAATKPADNQPPTPTLDDTAKQAPQGQPPAPSAANDPGVVLTGGDGADVDAAAAPVQSVPDEQSTDPGYDSDIESLAVTVNANLTLQGQTYVPGDEVELVYTEEVQDCVNAGLLSVRDA